MRSCFAFVTIVLLCSARAAVAPADFRAVAHDFYEWNEVAYPVTASSLGDHRFDAHLTDYRMSSTSANCSPRSAPSPTTAGARRTVSIASCLNRNWPRRISLAAG